jgi:hypothetical protein
LVVPRQAVRFEKDKARIVKKGVTGPSGVVVTACSAVDCVVESGLAEGDRVLLY